MDTDVASVAVSLTGGGYTNTDPESRRIKVADVNGRVKIKVVYVVLEAQYQSSLSAGEAGAVPPLRSTSAACLRRNGALRGGRLRGGQTAVVASDGCVVGHNALAHAV